MDLNTLFELENSFDQNNDIRLKSICNEVDTSGALIAFFEFIKSGEYESAIKNGGRLFSLSNNANFKAFLLQWIVACVEMNFDEDLRNLWIRKWNEIPNWSQSKWCLFLRKYQLALTMYFQSSYRESLSLFEQCECEADQLSYNRGKERISFHLALTYRNIGSDLKSRESLSKAKDWAMARNSQRMLERIEKLDVSLNRETWSLNQNLKDVEQLLKQKKYIAARKLILFACRLRRYEKRSWAAESEYLYLALVSLAFKKDKRFMLIYDSLKDPIVKERIITLSLNFELSLPKSIQSELSFLRQSLGIQTFQPQKPFEFLGQKIWKIKNTDVASLIKVLSENIEGCDKEILCKKIWNYDYDPVIHDPKIYKLIFKSKKILGVKDAIIAAAGLYRINPKYITI